MGKDKVVAVTVVAGGGHDQALLEQSLAVNALGIIRQDVSFRNVVHTGDRGSFPVAFSAENWDIHFVCSGLDVGVRKDIVISVTLAAGRGIWSPAFQSLSVDSGKKFLTRSIMADPAVDSFEPFGVGELLDFCIHVAGCAVQVFVDRFRKFIKVYVKRNSPALPPCGEIGIFVTDRTVFVCLSRKRGEEYDA
jgi:hypothetical protein